MNPANVFSSIQLIAEDYNKKLNTISEAQFQMTPPIGGWSYSEVYSHIFDASILSTETMEACLAGHGENRPTAFVVKLILFFGSFPPAAKYKVPKKLESRVKVISKAEAHDFIQRFTHQLQGNHKKMRHAKSDVKTLHPRLGYLNANQWLRFIEIHLKHHLKQLKRIEKSF